MLTTRGRRITVEFDPRLADRITEEATARSTAYRRVTTSDIVREAVARFLLPIDGSERSQGGADTTAPTQLVGSL